MFLVNVHIAGTRKTTNWYLAISCPAMAAHIFLLRGNDIGRGAPRSESQIPIIAGGNDTIIYTRESRMTYHPGAPLSAATRRKTAICVWDILQQRPGNHFCPNSARKFSLRPRATVHFSQTYPSISPSGPWSSKVPPQRVQAGIRTILGCMM